MSVFNSEKIDIFSQNMFLGKSVNVSRNDIQKHKVFENLTEKQIEFFWKPEKTNLLNDKKQFRELAEHEQHIFISNLKYQTLLDSIQGRAPCQTFLEICSLPELENFIITWSFFETIHSRSYTHIMQNIFPNPSIIFDDIPIQKEIIDRARPISGQYDKLKELICQYKLGILPDIQVLKKQLYLTLVAVNILEGLRFYVSFACSFAFAQGKKVMEGNAKIISEIASDEALHLSATQHMINIIHRGKDDPDLLQISRDCKDEVIEMFRQAVDQEKEWAKYLFKDGSILGLNESILISYLEYLCDIRLKAIGLPPLYKQTTNPLPWMTGWLMKNKKTVSPQETEIITYLQAKIKHDDGIINDIDL